MRGMVSFLFFLMVSLPIIIMTSDIVVYGLLSSRVSEALKDIVKEVETTGEIPANLRLKLEERGLNPAIVEIESDPPAGRLVFQQNFKIKITGDYTFTSFNLLGTGIGEATVPISKSLSGRSEVWVRNGTEGDLESEFSPDVIDPDFSDFDFESFFDRVTPY